ncbi:hypothetical protein Tco_1157735 [Tanacetum coccineum]
MADANSNAPEVPTTAASPPTRSDGATKIKNFLFSLPVKMASIGKKQLLLGCGKNSRQSHIQDSYKGYSCQLDEQHFYLSKAILRDALQLPQDNNNFTSPPNANTIISFVNELGYPNVVRTLSGVVTNDMYQPWRALAMIINLCLMGKTSAFERPRAPVLQILWGVVNMANIDYAERIWEEFTQCSLLHLPYEEAALGYLKFSFKNTKRCYLAGEVVSDDEAPASKPGKEAKPKTPRKPKPKLVVDTTEAPPQAKRAKAGKVLKKRTLPSTRQLVDEFVDEGVPDKEPMYGDEDADTQRAIEESLKSSCVRTWGHYSCSVQELTLEQISIIPEVTAHIEGQAGSDPGKQVEAQAGSDHGVAADSQLLPRECLTTNLEVIVRHENCKLCGTGSSLLKPQQGISALPISSGGEVTGIRFKPGKDNSEAEVQIYGLQFPDIRLPIRIGELEQHMADLVDANQALEERLDKQGNMMYQLENLDIPRQASKAMEERIHLWETQDLPGMIKERMIEYMRTAPLRARFKDLPTSDMKEILLQRMLEENYDKGHEDHKMAYEALQTSILRDEREQFDADKAEKLKKMKGKQDSPKTPPGSPPPPPPPPPPSGASGASGSATPSSSKTTASIEYTAWTTTTSRLKPAASSVPEDVFMHEESDFEAQDMVSDDEDIGSRHIPKVPRNQAWFKPLSEEERPATPEPAWSIPLSSLHVPINNWASALASSYESPPDWGVY